jgi:glycosyltransferase involved in cell wall biosynthesis
MEPQPPQISVVVPTHNRRERLLALLDALDAQTLEPNRFEVIVVDDGSSDGTAAAVEARRGTAAHRLELLRSAQARGPAAGRNMGWRAATAQLVAFTDDDCEPAPRWLGEILAAADAQPGETAVQGRTEPIPRERDRIGVFTRTISVTRRGPWFQTCNMAYPRRLLVRLEGFEERYPAPGGEDTDLAWRAIEAGQDIVYAPAALVHHAVNELGPIGKLRVALRWTDAAWVFGRHPQLRGECHWWLFWKPSHAKLLLGLAGLAAARRFPPALVLALPWWRELVGRCNEIGAPRAAVPYLAVHDLLETFGAARGAVRYRVPIL